MSDVLRVVSRALQRHRVIAFVLLVIEPISSLGRLVKFGGAWQSDGLPIGWDFAVFMTGARVLQLDAARLYDFSFQSSIEHAWRPGTYAAFPFISPPFVAALVWPLTYVRYSGALLVWTLAGLVLAWRALDWLDVRPARWAFALMIASVPFTTAIRSGQSTLLVFAAAALAYRFARSRKYFLAGVACAAMLLKPHEAIGILLLFAFRLRRKDAVRFWAGFLAVSAALVATCFALSVSATRAYVNVVFRVLPALEESGHFDQAQSHNWRAFWKLAFPSHRTLAEILSLACVLAGVFACVFLWRRSQSFVFDFGLAVMLGLWCAPHGKMYDWTLLAIPFALAWVHVPEKRSEWIAIFALAAAVLLASEPIASTLEAHAPFSFQPSLLLLAALAPLYTRGCARISR